MKRILVTGGAGFIGSHTVQNLLADNKEVTVLDNLSTGKLSNLDLFNSRLRFVQGDILNFSLVKQEMSNCDAVVHLAALASVPQSIEDPITSLKTNTLGWVNVLQAVRELAKPIRLVYASSAAVYGGTQQLPCLEEDALPCRALSPYALEKMHNEHYADLYLQLFSIKSIGLRYFNVYGPRQDPASPYSGVISKFTQQIQHKGPLMVYGDGQQSRDFIHVQEVARANCLALQSDYHGKLNIATGKAETLNQLIQYIQKAKRTTAQVHYLPARLGDIIESYGSTQKAQDILQFASFISLEQGIQLPLN